MSILDEPGEVGDWAGGERVAWANAGLLWEGSWARLGIQGEGRVKTPRSRISGPGKGGLVGTQEEQFAAISFLIGLNT